MSNPRFGSRSGAWILADEGLFRVSARRLVFVPVPRPAAWISEALDVEGPALTIALATDAATISVLRSLDGGPKWTTSAPVAIPTINGIGDVRVASLDNQIAVLANEAGGANLSIAIIAASADSGATWRVARAPAGGNIDSADGALWFTGDVMGNRIAVAADGLAWQPISLPVKAPYWSVSPPADLQGDGVVVAVTTHTAGESELSFWSSGDLGGSWTTLKTIGAPRSEFQTVIPTATTPDGHWVAIWVDGSKVVSGLFGSRDPERIISPNGLPGNVLAVSMIDQDTLVAEAANTTCPTGKDSCASPPAFVLSTDGGQTWSPLQ